MIDVVNFDAAPPAPPRPAPPRLTPPHLAPPRPTPSRFQNDCAMACPQPDWICTNSPMREQLRWGPAAALSLMRQGPPPSLLLSGCGHTERRRGGPCRQTGQPVLHPACSVDVFPAFSMYSDTLQETQHAARAAPFTGWIQKPFREDATPLNGTEQEKKTCRTHEIYHNH